MAQYCFIFLYGAILTVGLLANVAVLAAFLTSKVCCGIGVSMTRYLKWHMIKEELGEEYGGQGCYKNVVVLAAFLTSKMCNTLGLHFELLNCQLFLFIIK